jgi:hypothetical protein
VTNRSGKHSRIYFRTACDHELGQIAQQCRTDSDAIRRLANRWLEILWRLWMDRKPYDEAFHLRQYTMRNQIH